MRILVLTHVFPPSYYSNAKRPFYVVRGLLDAGWEVDVSTTTVGTQPGASETVLHPRLRIFRRSDPFVRLLDQSVERQGWFKAGALVASGLIWPDAYLPWALRALRTERKLSAYDRVLVFILPASLMIWGLCRKVVGKDWILDFQEPITTLYRRHPRRSIVQRLLLPLLGRLERYTVAKVGRAIYTSETNRQACIEQGLAREEITSHIPYFYDADVFRDAGVMAEGSFQIGYFGSFDWRGERNPETFFRALANFLQKRPEARPHTRFVFHGNWLPEHNQFIEDLKLGDVVSISPTVPYERYLQALKQCPVLLLVVAPEHNLYMPSKIVDYLGARRPILGFLPREAEMRRVLEQAGMAEFACEARDVDGGGAALERLWQRHLSGALAKPAPEAKQWSSEIQMPRYLRVVTN